MGVDTGVVVVVVAVVAAVAVAVVAVVAVVVVEIEFKFLGFIVLLDTKKERVLSFNRK